MVAPVRAIARAVACRLRVRKRQEQGVVAIFLALTTVFLLIPLGGLVTDIGVQRAARRDMQAIADTTALDMGRSLSAGTTPTDTLAAASAAHNSGSIGSTPLVHVYLGYISSTATYDAGYQALGCGATKYNSYFTSVPGGSSANAVLVTATTTVHNTIMGGSNTLCRSSIAEAQPTACFKLGSYAARLSTGNSALFTTLLNGALGNLTVSAASYQGLATASIGLASLAAQLGVGTVSDLATAKVSYKSLLIAAANVLSPTDTTNAALLQTIAATVSASATVDISKLLDIASGQGAVLSGTINALDLLSGSAFLINGTNLLSVPSLAANVGLTGTSLTSSVKVIEGLQEACGPKGTTASTSQAAVTLTGTLASTSLATPSGLLGLTLATSGTTNVSANLASATGTLTGVTCASSSATGLSVSVASQLATLGTLSTGISISGSITNSGLLGNLLGGLLGSILSVQVGGSVTVTASLPQSAATQTASLLVPGAYTTPVTVGSSTLNVSNWTVTVTPSLTLKASGLLGTITLNASQIAQLTSTIVSNLTSGVVNPLLSTVDTTVISPLSTLLGLEYGGADVYAVPTPDCTTPALVG